MRMHVGMGKNFNSRFTDTHTYTEDIDSSPLSYFEKIIQLKYLCEHQHVKYEHMSISHRHTHADF